MECRVATTFDWEWGPSALQRLGNAQALCVYIHTLHYVTLHYITYHTIPYLHIIRTYIHYITFTFIFTFTLHYINYIHYIHYIHKYIHVFLHIFHTKFGKNIQLYSTKYFGVNYIDIGHDVLETYRLTDMKTSCPHTQDAGRIARSWSRWCRVPRCSAAQAAQVPIFVSSKVSSHGSIHFFSVLCLAWVADILQTEAKRPDCQMGICCMTLGKCLDLHHDGSCFQFVKPEERDLPVAAWTARLRKLGRFWQIKLPCYILVL